MSKLFRGLILAAVVGGSCCTPAASIARAQDAYWNNHWQWYDNTYRPYYHRYYAPSYYNYGTAPYGSYNATPGYAYPSSTYYGPGYVQPYYGTGVQVGPLRFGWW